MIKSNNGQEHVHHHENGKVCNCGHEHNQHSHGADCDCGECFVGDMPGAIRIERKLHDEAIVISGSLTVFAEYETVRESLKTGLEDIARAVSDSGGVVGHVKASASVTRVEMFSVTDESATVKATPECEIKINLVAIVFLVPPHEAEALVRRALENVKTRK